MKSINVMTYRFNQEQQKWEEDKKVDILIGKVEYYHTVIEILGFNDIAKRKDLGVLAVSDTEEWSTYIILDKDWPAIQLETFKRKRRRRI